MPKRKEPELDPKEQFKRFIKTAKEHGVANEGPSLEDAFKKLVPAQQDRKKAEERQ